MAAVMSEQDSLQNLNLYNELIAIGDGIKQLKADKPEAYKQKVR